MSVHLSISLSPKPLSLLEMLLLTIEPINHRAYQPSSLSTIESIDHQAYWPLSLLTSGFLLWLKSLSACFEIDLICVSLSICNQNPSDSIKSIFPHQCHLPSSLILRLLSLFPLYNCFFNFRQHSNDFMKIAPSKFSISTSHSTPPALCSSVEVEER